MNQLAISTSSDITSIALKKNNLIDQISFKREKKPVCEAISANISQLLKQNDLLVKDINLIGVDVGPGSFTGLRIGIATANALALGVDISAIGVSSLELLLSDYLLQNHIAQNTKIKVGINAGRKQIFTALFSASSKHLFIRHTKDELQDISQFYEDKDALFIGYGLQSDLIFDVTCNASAIFTVLQERNINLDKQIFASPNYVRLSDAEVNHLKKREKLNK